MPTYCFSLPDRSATVERFFAIDQVPQRITVDGRTYLRDIVAEHQGFHNTAGNWPMKSVACGVGPDQVEEAAAYDRFLGVPDEYDKQTGDKLWRSAADRRKWCKAHRYYDRNAGYSDPLPQGTSSYG